MVENIHQKKSISLKNVQFGKQLLNIITNGMYSNPLMVIREYIQNAVDSIDEAITQGMLNLSESYIHITIEGKTRTITILDNGAGVDSQSAVDLLCGIGISTKSQTNRRGFRGIGRFGGIGYCDEVVFETRRYHNEPITRITWDCSILRDSIGTTNKYYNLKNIIKNSIRLEYPNNTNEQSPHFFKVTMRNIHRFHKDELVNYKVLKSYIGQSAPLPFKSDSFRFSEEIDSYLCQINGYRQYNISLNGDRLYKPYTDTIVLSQSREDKIQTLELFSLHDDNGSLLARGWYAITQFLASFPGSIGMRGLRVRQGNIAIGDEYFLSELFTERRFATWHIGEIHCNYSLRTNARRDGFEQSPSYERFLEQVNLLGKHLSQLCRSASRARCKDVFLKRALHQAEILASNNIVIDEDHLKRQKKNLEFLLDKIGSLKGNLHNSSSSQKRLLFLKKFLDTYEYHKHYLIDVLDGRSLRNFNQKELFQVLAKSFFDNYNNDHSAEVALSKIVSPYLKPSSNFRQKGNGY